MKYFSREIAAFLLIGGFNTLFTYAVYLIFLLITSYTVAYTVSYVIGIGASYVLNASVVFRAQLSWKKAAQFPLVYAAQYISGLGLIYLFVEKLSLSPRIAPILVVALTIPLTFILSRLIVKTAPQMGSSDQAKQPGCR